MGAGYKREVLITARRPDAETTKPGAGLGHNSVIVAGLINFVQRHPFMITDLIIAAFSRKIIFGIIVIEHLVSTSPSNAQPPSVCLGFVRWAAYPSIRPRYL